MPHSQKSIVSAKKSEETRKETERLRTKLHDLTISADWTQNRADFHWKQAKSIKLKAEWTWPYKQKKIVCFIKKIGKTTIGKYERFIKGSNIC